VVQEFLTLCGAHHVERKPADHDKSQEHHGRTTSVELSIRVPAGERALDLTEVPGNTRIQRRLAAAAPGNHGGSDFKTWSRITRLTPMLMFIGIVEPALPPKGFLTCS
jgi:hypothetical protein